MLRLAIFGGSYAINFFKLAEEMNFIFVAAHFGNLSDCHVGGLERKFSIFYPHVDKVLLEGYSEQFRVQVLEM